MAFALSYKENWLAPPVLFVYAPLKILALDICPPPPPPPPRAKSCGWMHISHFLYSLGSGHLHIGMCETSYHICHQKSKRLLAKKEEGNTAYKQGHLKEAYDLYTEALDVDHLNMFTNAKLYCNRALVGSKVS